MIRAAAQPVVPPMRELRHVDPHARRSVAYRAWARIVGTRPMGWLSRQIGWKIDPLLLRVTRGRLGFGGLLPTALLETRGARSGEVRRTGVIYFHDGARVTLVASKLGMPQHPAWYHNLRRHPDVRFGGRQFRAEVVEDPAERERLWELADRVFPAYATYRDRAARVGRQIPLVRLHPR
jgi:deazaflavin-dependent oxidoreductase (nitroreductase family)